MLQSLFPNNIVTVTATKTMWTGQLYEAEAAHIRHARPVRQKEFTAGRLCARHALKNFGIDGFPLLVGNHREPLWPHGFLGSISHCDDYCACAVTRQGHIEGIGLDVEPAEVLAPDIIDMVCTVPEKRWLDSHTQNDSPWSKLIFSAKESFYKAQFTQSRTFLDFQDVEVAIDPAAQTFTVRLLKTVAAELSGNNLCSRFAISNKHIFTAVTLYRNRFHTPC